MLSNQEISSPVLIEDLGMLFPKETSKEKKRYGLYKCSCGKDFKSLVTHIKNNKTLSCGCYAISIRTKHGLSNKEKRMFSIWRDIKGRTTNKNLKIYPRYGGRGIILCDEWKDDFINFYKWSMENGYTDKLTIDRIDNNGNYEPSNCRWTTNTVQVRNTRQLRATNTSGYRGVHFNNRGKKWVATIRVDYKRIALGSFLTALEAAKAYDAYVIENKLEHTINNVL